MCGAVPAEVHHPVPVVRRLTAGATPGGRGRAPRGVGFWPTRSSMSGVRAAGFSTTVAARHRTRAGAESSIWCWARSRTRAGFERELGASVRLVGAGCCGPDVLGPASSHNRHRGCIRSTGAYIAGVGPRRSAPRVAALRRGRLTPTELSDRRTSGSALPWRDPESFRRSAGKWSPRTDTFTQRNRAVSVTRAPVHSFPLVRGVSATSCGVTPRMVSALRS
ncbi:hypothetical protein GobsT_04760 [Gemmata obscuriglobus]|nr:hypothetical protein GobsT_04760 [Gemmata obscuriglobus]VTR99524.1 unnamed protein product [Gemmata obscuriglobus UQM 2246]